MIRKLLISLLALVMCFTACFALASCSDDPVVGPQGDKGDKGDQGEKGPAGEQGPVGPAGEQGIGVKSVEIVDGKLVFTYTDDTKSAPIEFPTIKGDNGADGEDGADGADGKDGVGIKGVALSAEGKLVITFTNDETTEIAIPVKNGENGADGADGRGIAKIESVAGKLVITYTDNTTEEVALPTVECAHENGREEVVLKNHTLTENGTYLYVCNDCGHSEIAYKTVHDFTVGKVTPATCTTPKKTADVCKICGLEENAVEVGEPLGHAWVTDKVVVEEGNTICEDGGQKVDYCTVCYAVTSYVTGPTGHDVAEWTKVDATKATTGSLTGICETCGKTITVELPKLDKVAYAYAENVEVKSCASRKGVATYTIYVNAKGELVNVETEGYTAYVTEVALAPSAHTLNGELMTKAYYDWNTKGITEFNEEKATCKEGTHGRGFYTCEECDVIVYVETVKDHTYAEKDVTVTVEPDCINKGSGTVKCEECEEIVTGYVSALGHDWKYELVEDTVNNKKTLKLTCQRDDCGVTETLDVESVTEEAATCTAEGKITVVAIVDGESVTKEFIQPKKNHVLNGVEMNKKYYAFDTEGITEFDEEKATCVEGTHGRGYYTCDVCKVLQYVETVMEHTWSEEGTTKDPDATCTVPGTLKGFCVKCNAAVEEEIPAKGHDFEYAYDEETKILTLTCKVCDEVETYEVTEKPVVVEPTCILEGSITVTVVIDGKTVVKTFPKAKVAHTLNGKLMTEEAYPSTTKGITEFHEHIANCLEGGKGYYTCEVCNVIQYVETTGDHDGEVVIEDATCTEAGTKTTTCKTCNKVVEEEIPALGHAYTVSDIVNPTDYVEGSFVLGCSRCEDYEETVVLPVLGDDAYEVVNAIIASCKNEGRDDYTYNYEAVKDVVVEVKFSVVLDFTDHVEFVYGEDHIYTWLADVEELVDVDETVKVTYFFIGYVCEDCAKMIVLEKEAVEREYVIPEGTKNLLDELLDEETEILEMYKEIGLEILGAYAWTVEVTEGEGEEAETVEYEYNVIKFKLILTGEVFYVVNCDVVEDEPVYE